MERQDLLIQAVLDRIRKEMDRLYWNKNQKEMESPFDNTGQVYSDETFEVRAYYWGDDELQHSLPNFVYKDFKCYWYKHSNRGLSWYYKGEHYGKVSTKFLNKMLNDCFKSMNKYFKTRG